MAYTVLARRYRSSTFDEVIGQEHVAQTLKKAIESDRVAHAYLFNGTRGVGKTSMARILAKALNCQSFDGPTPTPCGTCDSCVRIARGDDIDVIEIDAASNTGVDNVRDVIENSQYRPARSRFKIYIIDEAHMLSKQAFNALLKTLEEPPGHVKFILATTEPEKILPTILSRCQRYDFRNIPTREIAGHLKAVCGREKIVAEDDALLLVAKAGAGSMRDSLSLLDRLLSVGETRLTVEMIEQLLGLPKSQLIFDVAQAIGDGDTKATLTRANGMVQSGLSVDSLIAALTDHLRNLLILRTCGPDSDLVEVPGLPPADLVAQSERFDPVALTQDISILEELRRHVRQSQAGRALLDATLVRLALSDQFASVGEMLGRLDGSAASGSAGRSPAAPPRPPAARAPAPPAEKKNALEPPVAPRTVVGPLPSTPPPSTAPPPDVSPPAHVEEEDDLPAPGKVWEGPKVSLAALMKQHAAQSAASAAQSAASAAPAAAVALPSSPHPGSNVESVAGQDLTTVWNALLDLLKMEAPGLHGTLIHGELVTIADGRAVIRYGAQHDSLVRMLDRNGKREQVRDAMTRVLKQSIGVKFELDASPAAREASPPAPAANAAIGANPGPAGAQRASGAPARTPPAAAPVPSTPSAGARVTPELVQSIRENEPLVKALMDELGATIVKVEL